MRISDALTIALGLVFGHAVASPAAAVDPKCTINNCVRAIVAGSFPNRPTISDCSSYQLKTVTPSAYTSTVWETITPVTLTLTSLSTEVDTLLTTATASATLYVQTKTVTATVTAAPLLNKRGAEATLNIADLVIRPAPQEKRLVTIEASIQPTYATACSTLGAYASACSCIGVTATTTTAETPTVIVTSTSTATGQTTIGSVQTVTSTISQTITETVSQTSIIAAAATVYPIPSLFKLKMVGAGQDGKYLTSGNPVTVQSASAAYIFRLDGTKWIRSTDSLIANTVRTPMSSVYFDSAPTILTSAWNPLSCSISVTTLEFTCTTPQQTSFQYCSLNKQFIIASSAVLGCESVKLIAIKA